jgi:hypothetical protein
MNRQEQGRPALEFVSFSLELNCVITERVFGDGT